MLTLKDFTAEMVKQSSAKVRLADSLVGRGAKHISGAATSALKKLRTIIKSAPGPEEQRKAVTAFMDSAAGKTLKAVGVTAYGLGQLAKAMATSKAPGGKRKLDVMKGLITLGPPAGMYYGMKRGEMKTRRSKYYGQKKPPSLYSYPRRRLN